MGLRGGGGEGRGEVVHVLRIPTATVKLQLYVFERRSCKSVTVVKKFVLWIVVMHVDASTTHSTCIA